MSGTDGLTDIEVSSIQIQYGLGVGQNSNEGLDGQVLSSQGRDKPMRWVNQSGGALQKLTQGSGITISPDGDYDGSVAQTITATFPAFTGGNGITIDGTGAITTDNDATTMTNTGGDGTQNAVLRVPNNLTFIFQASSIPYNGSGQVSIDLDTLVEEAQPTASDGISITTGEISTDNDGTTIGHNSITKKNEVLRTPASLIAGTNITFTGGAEFDGSTEITISSADTTSTDTICFTRASTSNLYSFPNFTNSTDWAVASYGFLPVGDTFFTLKIPASIVEVMLNDTIGRFEMEWSVYIEELICGEGANDDFRDMYYKYQFAKDDIFTTDLQIVGNTYDFCSGGGANSSIGSVGSGIPVYEPNSQNGRVRVMKDVLLLSEYITHTETPVDVYIRVLMSNEPLTNNEKAHILLECGVYNTTEEGVNLYRPDWTMKSTPLKDGNFRQYVGASPSPSSPP